MAHFAKISEDNKVLSVLYVNDSDAPTEEAGQKYLEKNNHWPAHLWIQTSYNTYGNQHKQDGTPFRGNYAGVNFTWDETNQIFWSIQNYPSWTKNVTTASWDPPIPRPTIVDDGQDPPVWIWSYGWDEDLHQSDNTKGWVGVKYNEDNSDHSDTKTYDWNGSSWVVRSQN